MTEGARAAGAGGAGVLGVGGLVEGGGRGGGGMPISPLAVVPGGGGGLEGGGLEEARPRQHTRGNKDGAGRWRRETSATLLHVLAGNKRRYMVACVTV